MEGGENMIRSYKIRIYPNQEQKVLIDKHIGCCRFIWNYMLNLQDEKFKIDKSYLTRVDMTNVITEIKKQDEFVWLNEVSTTSLQIICKNLDETYKKFFNKKSNHPRYKTKKQVIQKYPARPDRFYFVDNKFCKIEKLGNVKYKTDLVLPIGMNKKFTNVTIEKSSNDKYFIKFSMNSERQTRVLNDYSVGIDLGIKDLAVISYNGNSKKFGNINKSKKMKDLYKRRSLLQKDICRKYLQNKYHKTNNIVKQEKELLRINNKITNIRDNYIHQTTHEIIELLPKRVVMENLDIMSMMKNKHLSRQISQAGFYKFKQYMKYKCDNNGIEFVEANRFYPSSKTCSCCGHIKHKLSLKERVFTCENCGCSIDRDINASINLEHYLV